MRKILAAIVLAITTLTGLGIATASPAGAAQGPCLDYGTSQGWWIHGNKLMQCIEDGNHKIVRQWANGGTVDEGVVFNTWVPGGLEMMIPWSINGVDSNILFCSTMANTEAIQYVTPGSNSSWERRYQYKVNGIWNLQGDINHFNGWAGTQAFGAVQTGSYNCASAFGYPYNGYAWRFIPG